MLNQSFSAENFRRILDSENRKGIYLEDQLFPDITKEAKECTKEIKTKQKNKKDLDKQIEKLVKRKKELKKEELRAKHSRKLSSSCLKEAIEKIEKEIEKKRAMAEELDGEISKLYEQREKLKEEKKEKLDIELKEISKRVAAPNFKIELERKCFKDKDKKPIYVVGNSPEQYFVIKQIQRNISRLFGVKQSNRYEIINQIKTLLEDGFPKYVIRTDISQFYESIPHEGLLRKINEDNLLSPFSKKIIKQMINQYKRLSEKDEGLPRGIGISAYLAELFMRDVDSEIRSMGDVSYYARYVDDTIIVFTPDLYSYFINNYFEEVKKIVEDKFHLKLNSEKKTDEFDLLNLKERHSHILNYLGYKITFGTGEIKTELTKEKFDKYKSRINLSFDHYLNLSKIDEKKARKLLVKRVRFLTGNTRLKNNKKNVLVGIYYSNSQLTEKKNLIKLDSYLRRKIENSIKMPKLQERLNQYNFREGFELRRFSPFKPDELKEMVRIWK